jgi:hypothetical protein
MLRYLYFDTSECGPFNVYVYPDKGPGEFNREYIYTFTPRTLGTYDTELGKIAVGNEQFRLPIHGRNTETVIIIKSDAPTPFGITGGGWEGMYTTRARRV